MVLILFFWNIRSSKSSIFKSSNFTLNSWLLNYFLANNAAISEIMFMTKRMKSTNINKIRHAFLRSSWIFSTCMQKYKFRGPGKAPLESPHAEGWYMPLVLTFFPALLIRNISNYERVPWWLSTDRYCAITQSGIFVCIWSFS